MPENPFKLRNETQDAGEIAAAESGAERRVEKLGTVEQDIAKTRSYNFFFSRLTADRLTVAGLQAFENPKFREGYLLDTTGRNFVTGPNGYIGQAEAKSLQIEDPEVRRVFRNWIEFKEKAREERTEADRQVRAINYFFQRLSSGRFSIDEAAAFENPKFREGLLRNGRDNGFITGPNGYLTRAEADSLRLGPELQVIFREFAEANQRVISKSEETRNSIRTLEYFRSRLTAGRLTLSDLKAFENPKFREGLLRNPEDNNFVIGPNGYVSRSEVDSFRREDVVASRELFELSVDPNVPMEIRINLTAYFKNSNAASLERLRQVVAIADPEGAYRGRIEAVVQRFDKINRANELKTQFYKTIGQAGSYEKLRDLLAAYDSQDGEDRALVQELLGEAATKRRLEWATKFSSALAGQRPEFDKILATVPELARDRNGEDARVARTLVEALYALEVGKFKDEFQRLVVPDVDPKKIFDFLDTLPVRPAVGSLDYVQTREDLGAKAREVLTLDQKNVRLKKTLEIRNRFQNTDPQAILRSIEALPGETEEDLAIRAQMVDLYRSYVAANRPQIFDSVFASEIAQRLEKELKDQYISPELGRNKEAFYFVRERFVSTIYALVESLRDDPQSKDDVEKLLRSEKVGDQRKNPRLRFIQRIRELEKQRPLTDVERMYMESVELLSLFNPYLVAAASIDPGVTQEFLRHHFEKGSAETKAELQDGDYIPLIQLGLGPQGLAAVGEVVRNNPVLAEQMLVIDGGELPGGPFAIPGGPAWELNSANRRGEAGPTLPEAPAAGDELKKVRAYGSPVARWYPGERLAGMDVRQGSINTTVDYLPTPDDLSNARYPTNEELALVISLQAALLVKRMALRTRLVKVEPNPNKEEKGDKLVTLELKDDEGNTRTVRVRTDAIFAGTGLGEPSYGFRLEGSRAQNVLEETEGSTKFPKLSTTLEAFKGFADRTREKKSPGKVLVIYGGGNSADTLIEYIGNIFQGNNPAVRDVTKVYVVSEQDLSSRPRYAAINDLRPRNGSGNLIEQVRSRVTDVDFASDEGEPDDRQLVVLGQDGRPITNGGGKPIIADAVIAAVGFKPQLDSIFESYLNGQTLRDESEKGPLAPITLPTNPDVPVADTLKADPNILFFGVASKARFTAVPKLAQLPREAREALLRNGPENAVAIGFRGPDTQAAINIWLNSRDISLPEEEGDGGAMANRESKWIGRVGENADIEPIAIEGDREAGASVIVPRLYEGQDMIVPDNVESSSVLLSSLFCYNVGNAIRLRTAEGKKGFSGELQFRLRYDDASREFTVEFKGGDLANVSADFMNKVAEACQDKYVQKYAIEELSKRRRNPMLELNVGFRNGYVVPRDTFVEAV